MPPGRDAGGRSDSGYRVLGAAGSLTLLLLVSSFLTYAAQRPSMLLFGATLSGARDFAVESARNRGWSILSVNPNTATFEQTLEEADTDEASVALRLVRIVAEFAEESAGVRVYLRAEEVESLGSGEEWMTDVTGRYSENLMNALTSLRAKWDARGVDSAPRTPESAPLLAGRGLAPEGRVGTWAYYAEIYAQSRGCELSEVGAILESAGQDWERHRVFCRDGRQVRVECRYGECTGAR